jgi:vacuolar-type H+-ATPase subunit C/Vma6
VIGFEYGNTRLRAWVSRLLDPARYQDLLASPGIDQMLASLADTAYGEDVETAMTRARGLGRLDEMLRRNLGRTLRQMHSFYEGRPGELVELVTDRWDRHNLRVLLRIPEGPGRAELVDPLLIPAGRLDEAALRELAAMPDSGARLDLLVSWDLPSPETAHALLRASREVPDSLEVALDRAYASRLDEVLGEDRSGAAAVLRAAPDTINLLTALRIREAAGANEPVPEPDQVGYLPGGLIDPSRWPLIARLLDSEEVVAEIGRQRTLPGWDAALADWGEHQDLTVLADRLRRATSRAAVSLLTRGDPLGLDVPVGYTHAKEAEVRNLRLIGRGIVHRLPPDQVAGMLEEAA